MSYGLMLSPSLVYYTLLINILDFINVIFLFDVSVKGNTLRFGFAIQLLPSDLAN